MGGRGGWHFMKAFCHRSLTGPLNSTSDVRGYLRVESPHAESARFKIESIFSEGFGWKCRDTVLVSGTSLAVRVLDSRTKGSGFKSSKSAA